MFSGNNRTRIFPVGFIDSTVNKSDSRHCTCVLHTGCQAELVFSHKGTDAGAVMLWHAVCL